MSEPADAFGAHITEGTLGRIGDREIGPGHVVLSEDRYRWLFEKAGQPIENLPAAPAPAASREAVARYLPGEPVEPAFARMLAAYARCERGCLDRVEGNPECRDLCRRAARAIRRQG